MEQEQDRNSDRRERQEGTHLCTRDGRVKEGKATTAKVPHGHACNGQGDHQAVHSVGKKANIRSRNMRGVHMANGSRPMNVCEVIPQREREREREREGEREREREKDRERDRDRYRDRGRDRHRYRKH